MNYIVKIYRKNELIEERNFFYNYQDAINFFNAQTKHENSIEIGNDIEVYGDSRFDFFRVDLIELGIKEEVKQIIYCKEINNK